MPRKSMILKLLQQLLRLLPFLPLAVVADPRVVASIKPVHSLVAGVMRGVGEPRLLMPGGASPHEYSLRPSDVRAINEANIVFWIGPGLESFMVKPLDNLKDQVRSVALLAAPGVATLPLRRGGAWESHPHGHDGQENGRHDSAEHGANPRNPNRPNVDLHVWLDPINAIAMVRPIIAMLSEIDPNRRADYERNGAELIERLNQLNQQLAVELVPIRDRPYIVFHDAYQYFERRYGLHSVGSVVLDPEQRPGARRVMEIQARIRDFKVRCVFTEPQFQPTLVETVIAGSGARRGVLDPLGAELPAGSQAYFQLLRGLAVSLRTCLGGA